MRRVAHGCIPPGRLVVLQALWQAGGWNPTTQIEQGLSIPHSTLIYIPEELETLGMLENGMGLITILRMVHLRWGCG